MTTYRYRNHLTIGLPLLNEEKNIEKTLFEIFNQNFKNFILIISDNKSNDKTFHICKKWARKKKNIKFYRQKKRLNINENFYFIYSKVQTHFFMWAAADDVRSRDYIETNINFLKKNPSFSASGSKNYVEYNKFKQKNLVKFDARGSKSKRYLTFLRNCFISHGLFYSIFRKINLKKTKKFLNYMAWDWIVIMTILQNGKFNRSNKGHLISSWGGVSTQKNYTYINKDPLLYKVFPFARFMRVYFIFLKESNYTLHDYFLSINLFIKIHINHAKKFIKKVFN